jgi:hypothetical protein
MSRRLVGLVLGAVLVVAAGCSDSDDAPSATLAPVAPVGPVAPDPAGGGVPPSANPAPSELLTGDDLAGLEGAEGLTIGSGLNPLRISGLCGQVIDYEEVWRAVARTELSGMVFGQSVFRVADAATAADFVAKLQSAEQGCTWEIDPLAFEYVGQETGVTPVGDAMFAYRVKLGRVGKDAPAEAGLIVYVQRGDKLILLHGPPKVDLDLVNAALAAATA